VSSLVAKCSSCVPLLPTLQSTMRTLGFRTHVLVAVGAAVGVIAALARPWYAPAPAPLEDKSAVGTLTGPVDGISAGLERMISQTGGITGWDALGVWGTVVAALAAVTAVAALACLVPAVQGVAREALRYGALACLGIVVWKLVDSPGANTDLELRFGAIVSAAAALIAFSSGSAVASAPLRRRSAPAAYTPPAAYQSLGSGPPPGVS
jgi:hypothetical protein